MDPISLPLLRVACEVLSGEKESAIAEGAQGILEAYFSRKTKEARQIILSEVRDGKLSELAARDKDDTIHLLYTFFEVSVRGRARENLILLAKLIDNLDDNDSLFADRFDRFSKDIAELDSEEIRFLARIAKEAKALDEKNGPNVRQAFTIISAKNMESCGEQYEYEVCARLVKTGFVQPVVDGGGYGQSSWMSFVTTDRFRELVHLTSLHAFL